MKHLKSRLIFYCKSFVWFIIKKNLAYVGSNDIYMYTKMNKNYARSLFFQAKTLKLLILSRHFNFRPIFRKCTKSLSINFTLYYKFKVDKQSFHAIILKMERNWKYLLRFCHLFIQQKNHLHICLFHNYRTSIYKKSYAFFLPRAMWCRLKAI